MVLPPSPANDPARYNTMPPATPRTPLDSCCDVCCALFRGYVRDCGCRECAATGLILTTGVLDSTAVYRVLSHASPEVTAVECGISVIFGIAASYLCCFDRSNGEPP